MITTPHFEISGKCENCARGDTMESKECARCLWGEEVGGWFVPVGCLDVVEEENGQGEKG